MKYKVGDKVKIKSIDWYDQNINCGKDVVFSNGYHFTPKMTKYCDVVLTILDVCERASFSHYIMEGVGFAWTDDMIAGLAEEKHQTFNTEYEHPTTEEEAAYIDRIVLKAEQVMGVLKSDAELPSGTTLIWDLRDGFEFVDEDGKVINTKRIYMLKKQPKYPTTYEECAKILLDRASVRNDLGYKGDLLVALQKLLVCRDAYWKIAGWKPDYGKCKSKYYIHAYKGMIDKDRTFQCNRVLAFPTSEMRDTFYENFKDLIESCKELL